MHTNSRVSSEKIQLDTEEWLEEKDLFKGDTMVINGNIATDEKCFGAQRFVAQVDGEALLSQKKNSFLDCSQLLMVLQAPVQMALTRVVH